MLNRFQKWAIATTVVTYFLILVGGFVRAAGAGLGCPDWPRCFEGWIPPTHVSQLPAHIDPSTFNIKLAWIEYINRLIGVSVGILIFITLILAIRYYRHTPRVLWPTVAAFLGVVYEGWLGAQVVASELEPWVISLHLSVALVIVSLLLYATVCAFFPGGRPRADLSKSRRSLGRVAMGVLVFTLVQIAVGADLRGQLEVIAQQFSQLARGDWITQAGWVDSLHRSLALVLGLCVAGLVVWIFRSFKQLILLKRVALFALALVVCQILAGVGLAYWALPPPLQVVHLGLGSLLMGTLTLLVLLSYRLDEPA